MVKFYNYKTVKISIIVIVKIIAEQVFTAGEGPLQWEQWVILSNLIYDIYNMSIVSQYSSIEQSSLNMMNKINNCYELI